MSFAWLAGENVEASFLLLPAATTYVMPLETELVMAVSNADDLHWHPKLRCCYCYNCKVTHILVFHNY